MSDARQASLPAILLVLLLAAACNPPRIDTPEEARAFAARGGSLVVLGVDGMDWALVEPMLERGELPELARLLEEGVRIPMRGDHPLNSPALWTSMATGMPREAHGVLDFVYLPEGGERQVPAQAGIRTRLSFWEILTFLERESVTVGWFVSWPATPVKGALVTDRYGVADAGGEGPVTWPPALAEARPGPGDLEGLGDELRDLLTVEVASSDPVLRPGGALEEAVKYLETDLKRARLCVALTSSTKPVLSVCYLQVADAVSHFAWKYLAPDAGAYVAPPDPALAAHLSPAVETSYRMADRVLGALREAAGPEARMLLVSDHGFQPFVFPDSILVHLDVLLERLDLLRRGERGEIDIPASAVFPGGGTGVVEPLGVRDQFLYLNPAAKGAPSLDDLIDRLKALRTEGGRPLFESVLRSRAAAAPGVTGPDLVVRVSREILRDERILLPDGSFLPVGDPLLYQYDDVSGTHRPEAVLVAAGPGLPRGVVLEEEVGPEDVFAMILWLSGAPLPADVDGRVPRTLLGEAAPPLATVPGYEAWIDRRAGASGGGTDDAMMERLRSLGYID